MRKSIYSYNENIKGYSVIIDAYYFKEWIEFKMKQHIHYSAEIMYVLSGSTDVEVENEKFSLHSGDLIMIDSFVHHAITMEKEQKCRMLNVEFRIIPTEYTGFNIHAFDILKLFLSKPKTYFVIHNAHSIYTAFKDLILELSRHKQDSVYELVIWSILAKIARMYDERIKRGTSASIYVEKAIEYIHHHYDENIKVSDIATCVSLNPNYLQRLFKEQTSTTITNFLLDVRLEHSKMLIENTDIKIDSIHEFIGFSSKPYFYTRFKEKYNVTPLTLRNQALTSWENG